MEANVIMEEHISEKFSIMLILIGSLNDQFYYNFTQYLQVYLRQTRKCKLQRPRPVSKPKHNIKKLCPKMACTFPKIFFLKTFLDLA